MSVSSATFPNRSFEDPGDLADRIIEVLGRYGPEENKEWRKQIASYARNHYAQDKIIEELNSLYQRVKES